MDNLVRDIQQMNKQLLKILLHNFAILSQKQGDLLENFLPAQGTGCIPVKWHIFSCAIEKLSLLQLDLC